MRMNEHEMAEVVAMHGARRYAEKRGFVLPMTVGAMLPGIAHQVADKYSGTRRRLDAATDQPLDPSVATKRAADQLSLPGFGGGLASAGRAARQAAGEGAAKGFGGSVGAMAGLPLGGLAGGLGGAMSKGLDRLLFGREFGEKKDPLHMAGSAAVQNFGKEMGTMGAGLLRDMAAKAMAAAGSVGANAAREAILTQLRREDPVIAVADDKVLMEAYHTMQRFAPTLSTDKNAVRSFLRQAATSGNGLDYMSIKLLADTERAITGDRKD